MCTTSPTLMASVSSQAALCALASNGNTSSFAFGSSKRTSSSPEELPVVWTPPSWQSPSLPAREHCCVACGAAGAAARGLSQLAAAAPSLPTRASTSCTCTSSKSTLHDKDTHPKMTMATHLLHCSTSMVAYLHCRCLLLHFPRCFLSSCLQYKDVFTLSLSIAKHSV
jgi:hypothetical protein